MNKLRLLFMLLPLQCLAMEQQQPEWQPWDAKLYDKNCEEQDKASLEYLKKIDLSHVKTILVIGCRTGRIANTLAQDHTDTTCIGIDAQQSMIDLGVQHFNTTKNLTLVCASPKQYTLGTPADFVACYHTLHWIDRPDLQRVFNTITTNMHDNGIVDIHTSAQQGKTSLTKAVQKTALANPTWWSSIPFIAYHVFKGQKTLTLLNVSELRNLATTAGLSVQRCEETDDKACFASKAEFIPWLKSILKPHGLEALQDRQDEFVDQAADLYCKDYNPATDGTIEYRFKGLHLTAQKSVKN